MSLLESTLIVTTTVGGVFILYSLLVMRTATEKALERRKQKNALERHKQKICGQEWETMSPVVDQAPDRTPEDVHERYVQGEIDEQEMEERLEQVMDNNGR